MKFLEGKVITFKSNLYKDRVFTGYVDSVGDTYLKVYYKGCKQIITVSPDRVVSVNEMVVFEVKQPRFTFKDFDTSVKRTWKHQVFKDAVSNAALGLVGESGEVADLIKKAIYHGRGFDSVNSADYLDIMGIKSIRYEDVKDELSDVLFYVSALAQEFGFTLEEVALHNKMKLEKRFPQGFSTEDSANKKDKQSK